MKIENHTQYSTADLRKILQACCRAEDFTVPSGALVRVVYARKAGRISGWAAFGATNCHHDVNRKSVDPKTRRQGCAMLLRIPRRNLNLERFVGVVRHEVGHWRGLRHVQMAGSLMHSSLFKMADHPWTTGLTLGLQAAPAAPRMADRVAAREQHAREMLAAHEAKLAREKTLVAKWRQKVRYYDRKAATVTQPESSLMAASPTPRNTTNTGL